MISFKRAQKFDRNEDKKSQVFVYATLMHPETRDFVLKHKENAKSAKIFNYKKEKFTTPEGKDFTTLVKSPGSEVRGDLLEISAEDLAKLEKWEDEYKLEHIYVDNQDAYTFILKNEYKEEEE